MIKQYFAYACIVVAFVALWVIISITQEEFIDEKGLKGPKPSKDELSQIFLVDLNERYDDVVLVDPEEAPEDIRDVVMKGYWLLMDTPRFASAFVGDRLSCRNCHFQAGNTLGGKNGSISLVGVSEIFPQYSSRVGHDIDLADRINMCFERSMNGIPLPKESAEMKAMVAYLEWISSGVKGKKEFPWLGLPKMAKKVKADPVEGKKQYEMYCAECHQQDGSGTFYPYKEEVLDVPPLWGKDSFNDGAGMHKITAIAPFIWLNMPYQDPELSDQEAVNIGEYIIQQPRPRLKKPS